MIVYANGETTSQKIVVTSLPKPSVPKIITENYEKGKQCPGVTQITLKVDQPVADHNYQWLRNGTQLSNATSSTYRGVLPAGDYTVISSKDICTRESAVQTIEYDLAPEVPLLHVKGPVVWYLAAGKNSYKQYKWYYNDQLITGATKYIYVANKKLGTYRVEVADDQCFTSSDNITIPTTKSDMTNFNVPAEFLEGEGSDIFGHLNIYPNPSSGIITVEMNNELNGDLLITILTLDGKVITDLKAVKSTDDYSDKIDLTGYSKGHYYIKFELNNIISVKKIILE